MTEIRRWTVSECAVWVDDPAPGGYVCAVEMADKPDGICGYPIESEPCPHHPPYPLDNQHCQWIEEDERAREE